MAVIIAGGGSLIWLNCKVTEVTITTVTSIGGAAMAESFDTPDSMDILLLGCDKRPGADDVEETRSDTVMLVHVDSGQDYLSILSLPRDLRVDIPGQGPHKLNKAYQLGGWELTAKTIEELTHIEIDHYVEVDFQAFRDITDRLGGVYVDVDYRYYNDNAEWELIKLSPGYQLLDGADALDYVRFRHDLNFDFGRMDRQQRFLTAIREQAMGWNLVMDLPGVVDAVFSNLRTTLGTWDIINLAAWGIRLDGSQIRQVSVSGDIQTLEDQESYVIPAEGAVAEAVEKLLSPPGTATPTSTGTTQTDATETTATTESPVATAEVDTSDFTTDLEAIENSRLWKLYADAVPFQLMAPGYLPRGYAYHDKNPVEPGAYDIKVGDEVEKGFKMVYRLTREGDATDQYMGIMQTTWLDAPAASPGREIEFNGVTFTIVGTSQSIDHVWWIQNDVLYWVSNTLSYYLSSKELMKVAASMMAIPSGVTP
ncbi:MAG: LCP family protein [Thermoleophilia bacterium]|nr:LCP family protein [Thermoleophilia bacterium]